MVWEAISKTRNSVSSGIQTPPLSSAEAPVSKHQWKKIQQRERWGEKTAFPAFPTRFNFFPLPSLRAFLPSATVGGLCGGERNTSKSVKKTRCNRGIARLTIGFLLSLGLMHRTKKGWQAFKVFISKSRDFLNWAPRVGERFLVSSP